MQSKGIVTGENNSVTIANIALHYIIKNITEINEKTKIFRRFIDDIIFITKDNQDSETITSKLTEEFGKYNMTLTYREISTRNEGEKTEFLDVLHCTCHNSEKNFYITDFIKPTAVDATFLHGKSSHPSHTFKGIIIGEAKRLLRLNERDIDYKKSIERLQNKCIRSGFNRKITTEWIAKVKDYKNIWSKEGTDTNKMSNEKEKERKPPWATSFGNA